MSAGRRRTFNKDIALDKAIKVFWTNGYWGTSLRDLTDAMGIKKPSLYAAFGNKEELFISALERYVHKYGVPHLKQLYASDKSLNKRIQCYLKSIAEMLTDYSLPGGCFVALSTYEAGGGCLPFNARQAVTDINEVTKSAFVEFFTSEKTLGNVQDDNSPITMANYLLTLQFGLAVMARSGATLEDLDTVIKHAVSTF